MKRYVAGFAVGARIDPRPRNRPRFGEPGRLRIALASLLSEATGRDVRPEDLIPATGHWRTSHYADVHRWELATGRSGLILGSWDTMTECVKRGIVVDLKEGEVHAK